MGVEIHDYAIWYENTACFQSLCANTQNSPETKYQRVKRTLNKNKIIQQETGKDQHQDAHTIAAELASDRTSHPTATEAAESRRRIHRASRNGRKHMQRRTINKIKQSGHESVKGSKTTK